MYYELGVRDKHVDRSKKIKPKSTSHAAELFEFETISMQVNTLISELHLVVCWQCLHRASDLDF